MRKTVFIRLGVLNVYIGHCLYFEIRDLGEWCEYLMNGGTIYFFERQLVVAILVVVIIIMPPIVHGKELHHRQISILCAMLDIVHHQHRQLHELIKGDGVQRKEPH